MCFITHIVNNFCIGNPKKMGQDENTYYDLNMSESILILP